MLIHDSCQSAIQACLDSKTFAIARLYNDEKTMSIPMLASQFYLSSSYL